MKKSYCVEVFLETYGGGTWFAGVPMSHEDATREMSEHVRDGRGARVVPVVVVKKPKKVKRQVVLPGVDVDVKKSRV